MNTVEFYLLANTSGGVDRVVESYPAPLSEDREALIEWAQNALPGRRSDINNARDWPEAVRVIGSDSKELFKWTIWDQIKAGKPTDGTKKMRRSRRL
jgi:hypothetical protein